MAGGRTPCTPLSERKPLFRGTFRGWGRVMWGLHGRGKRADRRGLLECSMRFPVGASNCRKERACAALDFRAGQAAHCTVSHECCKRFPGGGEQLPKSTRLCGAGFSRKARRQGEGVLEVRRAADDTALREKTSRPGAGFLAVARWGKAPFSERRPPPAFPSVPLVPPFLPRDAIRARELSPRALFSTCIG